MRLVYTNQVDLKTGRPVEVKVGDVVTDFRGDVWTVKGFTAPHRPGSTGRVHCADKDGFDRAFYPGVIDAEWED